MTLNDPSNTYSLEDLSSECVSLKHRSLLEVLGKDSRPLTSTWEDVAKFLRFLGDQALENGQFLADQQLADNQDFFSKIVSRDAQILSECFHDGAQAIATNLEALRQILPCPPPIIGIRATTAGDLEPYVDEEAFEAGAKKILEWLGSFKFKHRPSYYRDLRCGLDRDITSVSYIKPQEYAAVWLEEQKRINAE